MALSKCAVAAVIVALVCTVGVSAMDDGTDYSWADEEGVGGDSTATGIFLKDAVKTGAVCLDGTAPVYYFLAGTGDGANKWYIHHQGGGWCESDENCFQRSLTTLGSSSTYPKTTEFNVGYFSRNASVNPMMYNWNMVFMRYCDGGSFSGAKTTPTNYNGHELHYRGRFVREAMMADMMNNRGLRDATDVVVSGCSAGGLATYLHADQVAALFDARRTKVEALPDSGFFIAYNSPYGAPKYLSAMQWVFTAMNASSGVNQDCITHYSPTQDTWHCMFAQYTSPFIKVPVFPLQSKYDAWQVPNILGNKSPALVNEYGANFTKLITDYLLSHQPKNGVFLDACYHHCGAWGDIVIGNDNFDQALAFQQFYFRRPGQQVIWEQDETYPCEACCHRGQ